MAKGERAITGPSSRQKAQLALVPNGQDAHFILRNHEPIQGEVPCVPIGNDQLAQLTFDSPTDQWMRPEAINGRLDGCNRIQCRARVFLTQELERALYLVERTRRIDYLRHGLGRAADSLVARRFIQA